MFIRQKNFGIALFVGILTFCPVNAFALGLFHETWVVSRAPSELELENLIKVLKNEDVVVTLADPAPVEIEALKNIPNGPGHRTLIMDRYPSSILVEHLQALKNWGLVISEGSYPTDEEIHFLNLITPSRLVLAFSSYAGPELFAKLHRLPGIQERTTRISFIAPAYPRFLNRDSFLAAPSKLAMEFYQDYWPQYIHMDVFNMIPQPISLRVREVIASVPDLLYAKSIRNLEKVVFDSAIPLSQEAWDEFSGWPLKWVTGGAIPTDEQVTHFAQEGRTLEIDSDEPLAPNLLHRWSQLPVHINWVHLAPGFSK
jgi:hypothetical protein